MKETLSYLKSTDFPLIKRASLETVQLNLGYLCNQQCLHCHVDASPRRKELMSRETMQSVIRFAERQGIKTLDLTGGAPEMNPHFKYLVEAAREAGIHVIDRCNLTILSEPGYDWLARFLAEHRIEVIASMPCYLQQNVDAQRGKGVFDRSIEGLRQLNDLGYGSDQELVLNLVYNPQGAVLPPEQHELEKAYKKTLSNEFGIVFNQLYTLANMPIKRFGSTLLSKGEFDGYMQLLKNSYQPINLEAVMCRRLVSFDWQGYAYDCDFNQMLGLKCAINNNCVHVNDLLEFDFENQPIVVMDHCYGCTAGQGSSCGGSLNK